MPRHLPRELRAEPALAVNGHRPPTVQANDIPYELE